VVEVAIGAVLNQEPAFSRYEVYEEKTREEYRPKGLSAFAAAAREYMRMLYRDRRNTAAQPFRQPPFPRRLKLFSVLKL
jgi:hypothetical protein